LDPEAGEMRNIQKRDRILHRWSLLALGMLVCGILTIGSVLPAEEGGDRALLTGSPVPAGSVPEEVWEIVAPDGISAYSIGEIEAANQNIAYAIIDKTEGTVLKTTNYGDSWSLIDLHHPDPTKTFGWTQQVSVVDPDTVWVGSVHSPAVGIAITSDGGGDWAYAGAISYQYALEATNDTHGWIGGYFAGGGGGWVYETFTGGGNASHWIHKVANAGPIHDISYAGPGAVWAVGEGGYHGWIWHENGTAWEDQTPSPYPPVLKGCCAVDSMTAWAVGGNKIYRTTDGGTTWVSSTAPAGSGSLEDVTALDSQTAMAAGALGTIIKTTDGGTTWTTMYSGTKENLRSIDQVDATHAWACGAKGTVLRLTPTNTRVGSDVTVKLGTDGSVTFPSVTSAGNTIRTVMGPVYFDNFFTVGNCIDILTTAAYIGPVEVRMPYNPDHLSGGYEDKVRLLHNVSGTWVDVTTNVDTVNNMVTGHVSSLSGFVLAYPVPDVTGITPNTGVRGSTITVQVAGSNFWGPPTLRLEQWDEMGLMVINATTLTSSSTLLSCSLSIPADAVLGTWTVLVENPDGFGDTIYPGGFTIMSGPSITVGSPNGGETFFTGSPLPMHWTYAGNPGTTVNIEVVRGTAILKTLTGIPIGSTGSGSFSVTIPSSTPLDTNYRIRVTSTSNPSITDTSDGPFGISASSITVVSPNGGETWEQGSTHLLTWNYAGTPGSLVKIEALRSGSALATIASGHPIGSGGSGSYSLTFPSYTPLGSDYQIRVTSTSNPTFTDTSNADFTIVPDSSSSITVVSPNGGENWTQGSLQTLHWNYTGNPGSMVRIEALRSGSVLATVTSGYPIGSGGSGSYNLTFPYNTPVGSDYQFRVTSTSNPGYTDTSDAMFRILPAIRVVSPNGGENYALGSLLSMNWTSTGDPGDTVMIEVFKGAALLKTLTGIPIGPAGSGSLQVTIPNTTPVGPDYTIRVTSTSYPACRDTSDAGFSIGAMAATFQGILVAYQSLSGGGYFLVNITNILDDEGGILHPGDQVTIRYASGLPPEYQQEYEIDPGLEVLDTVEVFCTIFGADLVLRDGNYVKGVV